MTTVLIAGGGTGGHVFPMLAVGEALRAADGAVRIVYVGTPRGLEARLVPERGGELELMDVLPLRGRGLRGFAAGLARAAALMPRARALVSRVGPGVVFSVGGYAAGPITLAARSMGVPVAILEPNSVLGLANRLITPLVQRAYVAFPEVERAIRPGVVMRSGVPLRGAFDPSPYVPSAGRVSVLVLGGSLGAQHLNQTVPEAAGLVMRSVPELAVVHQAGRERDLEVRVRYEQNGAAARARVVPFIDDVAAALASADIVIGRSGASACAELCAVGRPSILIPFAAAADDHQLHNARSLERSGAAIVLPQSEATPLRLAAEIERLARASELRVRMARAALERGIPDAAARIARDLLELGTAGRAR